MVRTKTCVLLWVVLLAAGDAGFANDSNQADPQAADSLQIVSNEDEYSNLTITPARLDSRPGLAFVFTGTEDMHYYADPLTAFDPAHVLNVQPSSDVFDFAKPVLPQSKMFKDPLGKSVEVYVGDFTIFIPIEAAKAENAVTEIDVKITGLACTSIVCLRPFEIDTTITLDYAQAATWPQIELEAAPQSDSTRPTAAGPSYSFGFALLLAFVAGLALNVMPCVWPVLPLIVMRIVQQSKESKGNSFTMGIVFCLGILLFFAALAIVNIILQLAYGTVLGWGDPFRSPTFVTVIVVLLVFLAMFMFGLLNFALPSGVAGKSGSGKGYLGSLGMGFLAAVLSTPCGFGVLAAAFGWAQTQHWSIATVVIMVIGIGMALPYIILISIPGLLNKLPRPGKWMELIKQGIGFTLLVIAVKFATSLSYHRQKGVLYFSVFLALAVWIWGTWVDYNTKKTRKFVIRAIAVAIVAAAGWAFLRPHAELIDWQPYDARTIADARSQGKPVLIKFTAEWCLNCAVAEKLVYSSKDVADLIDDLGVLAIKADTTENSFTATKDLKNIYNEPGTLPVNMLFPPGSDEPLRWHGTNFKGQLKEALEKLQDVTENGTEKDL